VHKLHRVPSGATDSLGYLRRLVEFVEQRAIDVVLPSHEQAWLLAAGATLLPERSGSGRDGPSVRPGAEQDQLRAAAGPACGAPARWRAVKEPTDLDDLACPYWLKREFSTAGQGVQEVVDRPSRQRALAELAGSGSRVMAQQPAQGQYGQVQALFDHGRLVAAHTSSVQAGTGMGVSAAARRSVDHPRPAGTSRPSARR
jgi:hypothetical protein